MLSGRSRIRIKILNYFFLNEKARAYINELARIIESDPKNVYRMLVRLEEEGMLKSEFRGKERYFFSYTGSPVYRSYKDIFLKTAGIDALLRAALKSVRGLKEAYIFGSYANGRYNAGSDIDVLLAGTHKVLDAQRILHKIQKQTGREINAVNMAPDELEKKRAVGDQFVKNIFARKVIKLI